MSAPRSTLKTLLGVSGVWHRKQDRPKTGAPPTTGAITPIGLAAQELGSTSELATAKLLKSLSLSARVNTRTTRTTLATVGFALLGVVVIVVFAISGAGVRDLRSQVVAGVITLVATIGGFYFGSRSSSDGAAAAAAAPNAGDPAVPPSPPTITPDRPPEAPPGPSAPRPPTAPSSAAVRLPRLARSTVSPRDSPSTRQQAGSRARRPPTASTPSSSSPPTRPPRPPRLLRLLRLAPSRRSDRSPGADMRSAAGTVLRGSDQARIRSGGRPASATGRCPRRAAACPVGPVGSAPPRPTPPGGPRC